MIIFDIIYFFPALVCAYWTVVFFFTRKTPRQTIIVGCTTVLVPYFVTYALLTMPNTNFEMLCKVDVIGIPLALLALAMIAIYMDLFITKKPPTIPHMALLIPGLMYTSVLGVLYYIIGIDDIVVLSKLIDKGAPLPPEMQTRAITVFIYVDQKITMYITLVLFILLAIECVYVDIKEGYHFGDSIKFFFFGKKQSPGIIIANSFIWLMILLLPVSLNYHDEIRQSPVIGALLAIMIGSICLIIGMAEYHSNITDFTLRNIINPKEYYQKKQEEARITEFARSEVLMEQASDNERSYKERRQMELIVQLRILMEQDKIFLDQDLNINQVAERLGIGRTLLSTVINKNFGKNFRSFINDYRIEYAKKFMLNNLSLTLEQVAYKCGFNDASRFSHKFKEIVGITPQTWITTEIGKESTEGTTEEG